MSYCFSELSEPTAVLYERTAFSVYSDDEE